MRFEHLIEINSPKAAAQSVVSVFTREQLWRGLMVRVQMPQRFPNGPQSCEWLETSAGVFSRTLHFGQHAFKDEVLAVLHHSLQFTPEPHGETAPIRLTILIEEPQPHHIVLRFVYVAMGDQTAEEAYYNDYRYNAWLHNDRDMVRSLREWLAQGEFAASSH